MTTMDATARESATFIRKMESAHGFDAQCRKMTTNAWSPMTVCSVVIATK